MEQTFVLVKDGPHLFSFSISIVGLQNAHLMPVQARKRAGIMAEDMRQWANANRIYCVSGYSACIVLILALERQRQVDTCEFSASLEYTVSFRPAGAT